MSIQPPITQKMMSREKEENLFFICVVDGTTSLDALFDL